MPRWRWPRWRWSQRESQDTNSDTNPFRMEDIVPPLKTTVFITGAFCAAWAWDLVFYGISHVVHDENPLKDQLAFGNQRAPKWLWVLLLQYLVVCGGAAVLSDYCQHELANRPWSKAAVMAVEFVPSPVFAGKLMAYLSQFSRLSTLDRALINLAATAFCAALAHTVPRLFSGTKTEDSHTINSETDDSFLEKLRLERFPHIVQDTLGFGLGIAWNVLLGQFAPQSDDGEKDLVHLVALISYLVAVLLIAFRLAAETKEKPETVPERLLALGSFAMYVVVAFTLATVMDALLAPGWIGSIEAVILLLLLSAGMSALMATVDVEDVSQQVQEMLQEGPVGNVCRCLVFVPCVWCCCPWILVAWLLAGSTENIGVKEHWFRLIAMVSGLAASIEASGMLTKATNELADVFNLCKPDKCRHPWLFVLLQTALAILTTIILIPAIGPLSSPQPAPSPENNQDEETAIQGERKSLLSKFKRKSSSGMGH